MIAVDDITTQAIVDGLDGRCRELDQKWGIGRLRLLVDDDLRARFDLQRKYFNVALANGDEKEIAMHGAGLRRGWDALDAAATAAGAEPLKPEVWECQLSDGTVVGIVRTTAEACHVAREIEVYTTAEIAQLIERLGKDVRGVKTAYPGAAVAEIRDREPPAVFSSKQERDAHIQKLADGFQPDEEIPFG